MIGSYDTDDPLEIGDLKVVEYHVLANIFL